MVRGICSYVLGGVFLLSIAISGVQADSKVALLKDQDSIDGKRAEEPKNSEIALYVFREKLKNVIAEVIRRDNISFKADSTIEGVISKMKLTGTRYEILRRLSTDFDFDWFEYNRTLYVSNKYERTTKFFTINAARVKKFIAKLDEAGENMDSFKVQYLDAKTTSISGPPSYVAIIATIIESHQSKIKRVTETEHNVDLYKGVKLHKIELDKIEAN